MADKNLMNRTKTILLLLLYIVLIAFLISLGFYRIKLIKEGNSTERIPIEINDFYTEGQCNNTDKQELKFNEYDDYCLAYYPINLDKGIGVKVIIEAQKETAESGGSLTVDLCGEGYDNPENEFGYYFYDDEKITIDGTIMFGNDHPNSANLRIFTDGTFGLSISSIQVLYISSSMRFPKILIVWIVFFSLIFLVYAVYCLQKRDKRYDTTVLTRNKEIDIVKFIALILVSWGHFVGVGTNAIDIQGVISQGAFSGTLLPRTTHVLWRLEDFIYGKTGIEFAVVGVVLFFISSGFFIPVMQKKYNSSDGSNLFFHSAKKIIPTLMICVLLNGCLVFMSSGISYSIKQYIATAFGIALPLGIVSTMGVLWYLEVLFLVYLLCSIIKKIDLYNLFILYVISFVVISASKSLNDISSGWLVLNMAYLVSYAGICYLGIGCSLLKNKRTPISIGAFLLMFIVTICNLKFYQESNCISSSYTNIYTYIFAAIIFAVCNEFCKYSSWYNNSILEYIVTKFGKIFLSFYLLHVHFGFTVIWIARQLGLSSYTALILAYIFSGGVAYLTTKTIEILKSRTAHFFIKTE